MPVEEIPAQHLYAPYRLHKVLESGGTSRYLKPLRRALERGEVSALVRARVEVQEGRLRDSLEAYLATDPGNWTGHDARCLKMISQHAGLTSEVQRMLFAAISAGRIPRRYAKQFSDLAFEARRGVPARKHKNDLRIAIVNDQHASRIAVASAQAMFERRRLFLEKNYAALLERHAGADTAELTYESVLMLFLASLHEHDRTLATRWGQELKRRQPASEVIRWVDNLTQSTFGAA